MPGINNNVKDDWVRGEYPTAVWANDLSANVNMLNRFPLGGLDMMLASAAGFYPGMAEVPGILIFNGDESNTIPAYGVVLLNGSQTIAGGVCAKVKQPDTYGCQFNWYINGPAPIDSQQFGYAQFKGAELIAVYDDADGTPKAGEAWGPRSGTYKLKKSTYGFRVIGVEDSDNFYVRVISDPFVQFHGTPNSGLTSGGVGTATIYYRSASGVYTTTGINAPNVINGLDGTVVSGSFGDFVFDPWVGVGTYSEGWRIIQAAFSC